MNNNQVCVGMEVSGSGLVPKADVKVIQLGFVTLDDEDEFGRTEFKFLDNSVQGFCEGYQHRQNNDKKYCCQAELNVFSDSEHDNYINVSIVESEEVEDMEPVNLAKVEGSETGLRNTTFAAWTFDSAQSLKAVAFISSIVLIMQ